MTDKRFIEKLLKDSGFYLVRKNKHEIYADGFSRITVPGRLQQRMKKWISLQIRNAVKKRLEIKEAV